MSETQTVIEVLTKHGIDRMKAFEVADELVMALALERNGQPTAELILNAYAGADYSSTIKRWSILRSVGLDPRGDNASDDTQFGVEYVYCGQHLNTHTAGWCTVGIGDKLPLRSTTREDAYVETKELGLYLYGEDEQCTKCEQMIGLNHRSDFCDATPGKYKSAHTFSRVKNF